MFCSSYAKLKVSLHSIVSGTAVFTTKASKSPSATDRRLKNEGFKSVLLPELAAQPNDFSVADQSYVALAE